MDTKVTTRWTADGLVEITLDVEMAHRLHDFLWETHDRHTLNVLGASLAHTLNTERHHEPRKPDRA